MKKYFFGIQKKILLYSAMLIMTIVLIFGAIITKMIDNEQETIKNQYVSVTENILIKFDSFYKEMNDMTENVIIDNYVQSAISNRGMSITEREALEKTIGYSNKDNMVYWFVNSFGEVYSNRNVFLNKEEYENSILYKKLDADYAKLHFVWSDEDMFGIGGGNLYICRNIQSIEKIQDEAKIYFLVSEKMMANMMPLENGLEQIYIVFSDDEDICYGKSGSGANIDPQIGEDIRKMLSENKIVSNQNTIYMVETAEGILCAGYHADTGFTVVTFISRGNVNRLLRETVSWVLVVLFIGLFAAFLLSIYTSKRFSTPIQKMANVMDNFGMQSLDGVIQISTNTELDRIGNAYNVMIGNIKELLDTIRKKEKEVRRLEMESLLYQINPHFLYNTLDNVYMMARINGQTQIMDMVDALSRFLRITLSNGKDVISVKQELDHACAYMKIQQIRNSDLFVYEVLCDEELYSYRIPKMILQPLIENCIEHGFADIMEGGKIGIHIWKENEKLFFEVSNNGTIMENDTVNRMNQSLQCGDAKWENNFSKTGGGYGVGNVARRMKIKYDDSVVMRYVVEKNITICRIEFEAGALDREKGI